MAMEHRYFSVCALLLCLTLGSGCAQLAVVPPTPARNLDPHEFLEPPPGERYYVTFFASQTTPRVPQLTHSWGTVIHVVEREDGKPPLVEYHTISWMPSTLDIRPLNFKIEPAVNLGLHETLKFALARGEHVSQWGPYECRPNLYHRFLVQKGFLESGNFGYQLIDTVGEAGRTGNGSNCIHAMTDMDPQMSRNHYPLIRYGNSATRFIVQECRRREVLKNPGQTHTWLNSYLGLCSFPIIHRD
ncbi:MAG: hypothetical protein C5B58_03400 [Acidobacteria bacterium]|nr:MAG: hypothetical protein C5B58_03400 [Acidobacteriota bacterium]